MADQVDNGAEMILSPGAEDELFVRQSRAQESADVGKSEASYQYEPKGDEQCSGCEMFVPGFPTDVAGYCTKVRSFRGPLGMIFPDGWCKYFSADTLLADYEKNVDDGDEATA